MWFEVGVVFGLIAVLAAEIYLWKFLQGLNSKTPDPLERVPEPQKEVPEQPTASHETCEWLNHLFAKIIYDYVGIEALEQKCLKALNDDIEALKRQRPKLLADLTVKEFSMGSGLPTIKNIEVQEGESPAGEIVLLLDTSYDNGVKLSIETAIAFGIKVGLTVTVVKMGGVLRVKSKKAQLFAAFDQEPDIVFDVNFNAGGRPSSRISYWISNVMKSVIKSKLVHPNYKLLVDGDHSELRAPRELVLTVIKAENLAAMDSNGLSDPYYIASVENQTYQSPVKYTTLNPEWGESHVFHVQSHEASTLNICLFDRDQLTRDEFMGEVSLALHNLEDGKAVSHTLSLQGREEEAQVTGTITFNICLKPIAQQEELRPSDSNSSDTSSIKPDDKTKRPFRKLFKRPRSGSDQSRQLEREGSVSSKGTIMEEEEQLMESPLQGATPLSPRSLGSLESLEKDGTPKQKPKHKGFGFFKSSSKPSLKESKSSPAL
eukprot:Colp12_sorted_trinity150504_noHs@28214